MKKALIVELNDNLYSYIGSALGAWYQRTIFKTNVSKFVPIRKVKAPIDIKLLRNICNYFESIDCEYNLNPSYEFTSENPVENKVKISKKL